MDPRCMKMDPGWMNLYSKHEPKLEISLKNYDFCSKLDKLTKNLKNTVFLKITIFHKFSFKS